MLADGFVGANPDAAMTPEAALIDRFYTAFAARDHAAMAACYHPEVHFQDEVFDLHGPAASAMWHMLCERGTDLVVSHDAVEANDQSGSARWVATYSFGPKKRRVRNEIQAAFTFEDGLIKTHRDRFDFHRWARQALGPLGSMLGWTGWLRERVSAEANRGLERFIAQHPEYHAR